MRIRIGSEAAIGRLAGELIVRQLREKPDSVLGLATGSTALVVYREWVRLYREGRLRFAKARSFNLDEYVGLPKHHPQSYRTYMREHLFRHVDLPEDSAMIPDGTAADPEAECRRYEAAIEACGGIDWQLLGIGQNGHIGFNEPGPYLQANTHVAELAEETRRANARFFSSPSEVPHQAITVGMGAILKARRIVLVAIGEEKAAAVRDALVGPVTTWMPASFLQLHRDVTVLLDDAAASMLPDRLRERAARIDERGDAA